MNPTNNDPKSEMAFDTLGKKKHRLVDMEYLLVHRGGRGQSFVYELLYNGEGEQGERFLMGLLHTKQLKNKTTTPASWGKTDEVVAPTCPKRGEVVELEKTLQPTQSDGYSEQQFDYVENAYISINKKTNRSVMAEVN